MALRPNLSSLRFAFLTAIIGLDKAEATLVPASGHSLALARAALASSPAAVPLRAAAAAALVIITHVVLEERIEGMRF